MSRILVVDDSNVDRRLAGGLLEKGVGVEVLYAAGGREALEQLAGSRPDLVVTDLQMPDMNGLELVGQIRARYPLVPVILMTGQGSEDIAVQALEQGASSYVPKKNLNRDLLDTVENVLAVARADRRTDRLMDCLRFNEAHFVLENDPSLIPPLVDLLQEQITRLKLCDETGRIRVGIALEESLLNALYHGNLELKSEELRDASSELLEQGAPSLVERRRREEPYCRRRIHVQAKIAPDEAVFTIRDEGGGFDANSMPDPADPASLERASGRGLVLIRTFMDRVRFNDEGNEVTLVKYRET